jgi:hypothetical protein
MRFGTLERREPVQGSIVTVARELARCKLDLLGVQKVLWDKGNTVRAGDYSFFLWRRKRKSLIRTGYFVHHRIASAVKRVECVNCRMTYSPERSLVQHPSSECACTK